MLPLWSWVGVRRHLLVVVVLVLTLGGGSAVAASVLPRNSVGTKQIRPGQVKRSDLGKSAVTSAKVKNGSLRAVDFGRGVLPAVPATTPAEILAKLKTLDGAGSGIDADRLDGVDLPLLQKRVGGTCATNLFLQSVAANGTVGCGALTAPLSLAGASGTVATLTQTGTGNALTVKQSNGSNGARALEVQQTGGGPGIYSSSANGTGVWAVTGSGSSAAVLGDSAAGEVVVARQSGSVCNLRISFCSGIGAVVGRMDGRSGYGVRGFATSSLGGIGVLGQAGINGGTGTGIRGENLSAANTGNGVEGATNGPGAGVYGTESSANAGALAGRFDGNVTINGNLTVTGAKSGFFIDDPRDPAGTALAHTPVDTNEMVVTYSGNVRTGAGGRATVKLPDYAQAIAADWRYTLTPIGTFGQAIVEREVSRGAFVVRTEHPRTKVSWSVTGTRIDPFARKHPFKVVRKKTGADRGRYLHPTEIGKPASRGPRRPVASATRRSAGPPLASER
jgi:hypothetical protein